MSTPRNLLTSLACLGLLGCAFTHTPRPLPPSFYAMEATVDRSSRQVAYLGLAVELREAEDLFSLDTPPGVRVVAVEADSPAEAAGLVVGDILLEFERLPTDDPQRLAHLLEGIQVEGEVTLQIQRGQEVLEVDTKLVLRSTNEARYLYHVDRALLRAAFRDDAEGRPQVVELDPVSPLLAAGVKVGESILRFQGEDAGSSAEFVRRARLGLQPGSPIALVVRDAEGAERSLGFLAWDPETVLTEFSLWPLFEWRTEIGTQRGEFAIGTLFLTDLFRYRRDGNERYYSILTIFHWETGELILEEGTNFQEVQPE